MLHFNVENYQIVFYSEDDESKYITFGPISIDGVGEENQAVNVGAGEQVFRDKTGAALNFRTLQGGGSVTVSTVGDEIVIEGTGQTITQNASAPTATDDSAAGFDVGDVWLDTTAKEFYFLCDGTAGAAVWEQVTGQVWNEQIILASQAQISFLLTGIYNDPSSLMFFVNGVKADPSFINISGNTITWLNTEYIIDAGDCIVIQYR